MGPLEGPFPVQYWEVVVRVLWRGRSLPVDAGGWYSSPHCEGRNGSAQIAIYGYLWQF
jgi:hypothetical protein